MSILKSDVTAKQYKVQNFTSSYVTSKIKSNPVMLCSLLAKMYDSEIDPFNQRRWSNIWKYQLKKCYWDICFLKLKTYTGWMTPEWKSHPIMAGTQSMSSLRAILFNPGTNKREKEMKIWKKFQTYTGWLNPRWKSQPVIAGTQSMFSLRATLFRAGTKGKQTF